MGRTFSASNAAPDAGTDAQSPAREQLSGREQSQGSGRSRVSRDATDRLSTAEVLLETLPAVMGYVSSELRRSSPIDNPVHFRLLRALRRGSRNLHELAEMHQVRLPTMSRTVSVLEGRGWVERTRSTDDRRTVYVGITAEGDQVLSQVEKMAIKRTSSLLTCMPGDSVESLRKGLDELTTVMHEQLGIHPEEGVMSPDEPGGCEET